MNIRQLLLTRFGIILCLILLTAAGTFVWGFIIEPDQLIVRQYTINLPKWPAELRGYRIAAMSDIHAGSPHIDREKLREIVSKVNSTRPDLVVIAGDFVIEGILGGSFITPEETAAALKEINAKNGIFATLGNHDWWYDGSRVRNALVDAGIRVIDNDAARINVNDTDFWLVGLGDLWEGRPDLHGTMTKIPKDVLTIALTHNPDIFTSVPSQITLTIAGHTHGGQVAIPLIGRPVIPSKYGQRFAIGHIVEKGSHLFVTPGIGTSIIPVRFRVPPEISLLVIN
ncbi:MAG: metallophosphoesterase [Acidobacteria bacterium]|nr:metallophosphoesterase [Acidobacteriota bacterium]